MMEACSRPISDPAGTRLTRFNALRHGVLSRYRSCHGRTLTSVARWSLPWSRSIGLMDRRKSTWSRNSPASCGASEGCVSPRRQGTAFYAASARSSGTRTPTNPIRMKASIRMAEAEAIASRKLSPFSPL